MTTAREVMTPGTAYLKDDATVAEAARQLADATDGAVPVCDSEGHLRGMVTDRDLVAEVAAAGKLSGETRLIDLVRGEVVTVNADDEVEDAVATMRKHKVGRLPVVDGEKLVGMLSRADLPGGSVQ
ncbi:MAG TPA: CBS domain-containing protein [Mycobacteriales bacterium]|nr:CBS domain-containing protein [Mycobacteriales bacterium]